MIIGFTMNPGLLNIGCFACLFIVLAYLFWFICAKHLGNIEFKMNLYIFSVKYIIIMKNKFVFLMNKMCCHDIYLH